MKLEQSQKDYLEAIEYGTKGMHAISSGLIGECPECQEIFKHDINSIAEKQIFESVKDCIFLEHNENKNMFLENENFDIDIDDIDGLYILTVKRSLPIGTKRYLMYSIDEKTAINDLSFYLNNDFHKIECEKIKYNIAEIFQDEIDNGLAVNEASFSWNECNTCLSQLGGDRYIAHALDENNEIIHLSICTDCLMYFANGNLPEQWEQSR